eukprot:GHVU01076017.1.p1 GENE.GHVU01076017.1~~GHVU01076017.1.p1  ORF type:complete len:167 (+),score=12.48 GHVU01076017.1:199-699(+)
MANLKHAVRLYQKMGRGRKTTESQVRESLRSLFLEININGSRKPIQWADNYVVALTALLLRVRIVTLQHYVGEAWVVTDPMTTVVRVFGTGQPSLYKFLKPDAPILFLALYKFNHLHEPCPTTRNDHSNHYAALAPVGQCSGYEVFVRCQKYATKAFKQDEMLDGG